MLFIVFFTVSGGEIKKQMCLFGIFPQPLLSGKGKECKAAFTLIYVILVNRIIYK